MIMQTAVNKLSNLDQNPTQLQVKLGLLATLLENLLRFTMRVFNEKRRCIQGAIQWFRCDESIKTNKHLDAEEVVDSAIGWNMSD